MRLGLVSLIVLAAASGAYAQTTGAPAPTSPPPAPASPPAAAPPAPAPTVPAAPAATSSAPATQTAPAAPAANAPGPAVEAAPASPPPPPSPPTDPAAIAVLNVLEKICIPAANGGDLAQLAKANGYRKSGDNWTYRQNNFSLAVAPAGSNPTQCHVDVIHPVDMESPGRAIVVALNDWAGIINGWSLYRNDKSVQAGQQFTTRSWQHSTDAKEESLVFTTKRKADGTPLRGGQDESELIYGVQKVSS